jgi:hypothetical protein
MTTVSITLAHIHFARLAGHDGPFSPDEIRYLQHPRGLLMCVCVAVWGSLEAVFHRLRHTRNSCSSSTFLPTQVEC